MPSTLLVKGTLSLPNDDDPAPSAPIVLDTAMQFSQAIEAALNFDAPVTDQVVGLGTMAGAGARALFIKSTVGGCAIKLNDAISGIPIAAGAGWLMIINPNQGWLTALKVTTTGPAKVRVVAAA